MDGFEFNKIAGAILATLLFVLGSNKILGALYAPEIPEKKAYVVEGVVAEASASTTEAAPAQAEPELPLAALLVKADPDKGKKLTGQCISCHSFEKGGPNKTGPNLYGILGGPFAHLEGYPYSDGFKAEHAKGTIWSMETLFMYLKDPKSVVPGTKMTFAGLKKADQRADIIAYLRTQNDNPPPLPAAPK